MYRKALHFPPLRTKQPRCHPCPCPWRKISVSSSLSLDSRCFQQHPLRSIRPGTLSVSCLPSGQFFKCKNADFTTPQLSICEYLRAWIKVAELHCLLFLEGQQPEATRFCLKKRHHHFMGGVPRKWPCKTWWNRFKTMNTGEFTIFRLPKPHVQSWKSMEHSAESQALAFARNKGKASAASNLVMKAADWNAAWRNLPSARCCLISHGIYRSFLWEIRLPGPHLWQPPCSNSDQQPFRTGSARDGSLVNITADVHRCKYAISRVKPETSWNLHA